MLAGTAGPFDFTTPQKKFELQTDNRKLRLCRRSCLDAINRGGKIIWSIALRIERCLATERQRQGEFRFRFGTLWREFGGKNISGSVISV